MRGQISVEMFVAFSIALVLFGWLANFMGAFSSSASTSTVFSQEKMIANNLARLANEACVDNTSIQVTLPCIFSGSFSVPSYTINTSENPPAVVVLAGAANVSAASATPLCRVTGGFSAQCNGTGSGQACVISFNDSVRISSGVCP